MPHAWPARLIEMSSRPASSRRRISLRRTSGSRNSGCAAKCASSAVAIRRQPEEVVLLSDPLDGAVQRTFAVDEILLLFERLAADAVPALVGPFVDVAGGGDPPDQLLHRHPMPRLRRPDEVVVGDVERVPDAT